MHERTTVHPASRTLDLSLPPILKALALNGVETLVVTDPESGKIESEREREKERTTVR